MSLELDLISTTPEYSTSSFNIISKTVQGKQIRHIEIFSLFSRGDIDGRKRNIKLNLKKAKYHKSLPIQLLIVYNSHDQNICKCFPAHPRRASII